MTGEGRPTDVPPEAVYTLHTGLAYPLAYIAKAVSFVFNLSADESLDIVCKFTPPLIGIISLVVIYLVVSKIWNRKVGLLSAFAWAAFPYAVYVGAAGYLDRDGLTVLLLMAGAFVFYLTRNWQLNIRGLNIGWLVAGLAVLLIEGFLYLEWGFMGPLLLLAIIVVYFLVKSILGYVEREQTEIGRMRRLAFALSEANWRLIALIVCVNILAVGLSPMRSNWLSTVTFIGQSQGGIGVAELQGISLTELIYVYGFFLITVAIGIYLAWKKRSDGAIFFSCWFICFLAFSLFAGRVIIFAAPTTAVLSGLGLAYLWGRGRTGQYQAWKKAGVIVFLCILLLVPYSIIHSFGANPLISVDKEWQDAMAYIRDTNNTRQDAVVMTQWGWGYWILDMGQRKPVMDNGFYGYDQKRMHDVGIAYTTTDPQEAVQIMHEYSADYLIFSKLDLDYYQKTILEWAGLNEEYDILPEDSLVVRGLNGQFDSEAGLEVVYRSEPNGEVVILGLTN